MIEAARSSEVSPSDNARSESLPSKKHFLLVALGSAGDVHPFVGLGQTLQRRGHRVTIATCSYFRPLIERVGLGFEEVLSAEEYLRMIADPDLWHPMRGPKYVMQNAIAPGIRPVYDIVSRLKNESGRLVVAASSLALGARIAHDKLGVPTATVHLQPIVLRSVVQPGKLTGLIAPPWFPRSLVRAQYWLADVLVVDRLIGPALNGLRDELGLPPVRRSFDGYIHSPQLTIGLFPEWYCPIAPDWPPQTRLTGFPLYDEQDVSTLSHEVRAFLDAGPPPVVFTPGSAMTHAGPQFAAVAEACRKSDRRAILLTRHPEQLPKSLPPGVRHFDYVPFSLLLPHCAASIHHGGIGSVAQALLAGVPQVVMSMSHDQFDNAARLERMGVGLALPPKVFQADRVAATLDRLLNSPNVKSACTKIQSHFAGTKPLEETAVLLESL
jgi:UDP:flavonoid glycosyltransferase YjiC (YdhE family)